MRLRLPAAPNSATSQAVRESKIEDAIEYVLKLRRKAGIVNDPAWKAALENARVEVFSDLAKPSSGKFLQFINDDLLIWNPIPRPRTAPPPQSIGKPGLGVAENVVLGLIASLAEAGVANDFYRKSAATLNDLLKQIAQNGDADEDGWLEIERKLEEIANMRQSTLGYVWEIVSYGQGSIVEKRATAMLLFSSELADRYGYTNMKTWGELMTGGHGHFEKRQ